MTPSKMQTVAARAATDTEAAIARLSEYLTFPAISCDAEHAGDVVALASRIRDDLAALGFDDARLLTLEGALPAVAASWMNAGEGKPTLLIYGHLDLQPVKGEVWRTDPHVATRVGDRLYARGAADDMGGWVSHLAALKAWLDVEGALPCNVKLLIEGEEEIGSPNLERYMDAFPEAFQSDVMVLTDCENPSTDKPGLTVSLRGLMELELSCEALEADGHSGLWGGMVPDVGLALCKLISRLVDDDGRLLVGRIQTDPARRAAAWEVPLPDEVIRKGAHLIDGVNPLPHRGVPPAEWMWWQPAVTVVATTLPTLAHKKNALRQKATAILSVRLAPGQTRLDMLTALQAELLRDPPGGVKVTVEEKGWSGEGWLYEPRGPAFEAADRAYRAAWGDGLHRVGVGGSIPFVALFARRYGDMPLILNGVMDPETTAHGPNESLHLGVFGKAVLANVYLYEELARVM